MNESNKVSSFHELLREMSIESAIHEGEGKGRGSRDDIPLMISSGIMSIAAPSSLNLNNSIAFQQLCHSASTNTMNNNSLSFPMLNALRNNGGLNNSDLTFLHPGSTATGNNDHINAMIANAMILNRWRSKNLPSHNYEMFNPGASMLNNSLAAMAALNNNHDDGEVRLMSNIERYINSTRLPYTAASSNLDNEAEAIAMGARAAIPDANTISREFTAVSDDTITIVDDDDDDAKLKNNYKLKRPLVTTGLLDENNKKKRKKRKKAKEDEIPSTQIKPSENHAEANSEGSGTEVDASSSNNSSKGTVGAGKVVQTLLREYAKKGNRISASEKEDHEGVLKADLERFRREMDLWNERQKVIWKDQYQYHSNKQQLEQTAVNSPSSSEDKFQMKNISSEPGMNDVLCGRGAVTNGHIGNRRFRMLVNEHKGRYYAAGKNEKPMVAREVVIMWRLQNPPGRFLIKDSKTSNLWNDVGNQKAQEKASQCLRERRITHHSRENARVLWAMNKMQKASQNGDSNKSK